MEYTPPHAARCLKSDGPARVWLIHPPGDEPRVVKWWPLTASMAIKLLLGIAQPQRQVRGARLLRRAGLRTPRYFGAWRLTRFPLGIRVLMRYVPGTTALEMLRSERDDLELRRVARHCGNLAARIAGRHLLHRDLKLDNLIWTGRALAVVDTVGVRRTTKPARALARMLERLAIQPRRHGMDLPRYVLVTTLLAALRPVGRPARRAVLRRLR